MFRAELMAALTLLDRGDLSPSEMNGAWAGEIGQTQFVPSFYADFAVDYDGDGKRNLVKSVPDVIASTANLLKHHGWQAGQPWLEEVRVPAEMPWAGSRSRDQASALGLGRLRRDEGRRQPASRRRRAGVAASADGAARPGLPRLSEFRRLHAVEPVARLCDDRRLFRDAACRRGAGAEGQRRSAEPREVQEVQQRLKKLGYDVGGADGVIGAQTRAAVKAVQQKLGLPANSYPDPTFLAALRKM